MVRVEVAPLPLGVSGLVEKLVVPHAGSGAPVPVTLHAKLTPKLYPLSAVNVTVDVPLVPGATAAGVVAEILKSGVVVGDTIAAKASNGPPP
jgi:hypothetical protein